MLGVGVAAPSLEGRAQALTAMDGQPAGVGGQPPPVGRDPRAASGRLLCRGGRPSGFVGRGH